MSVLIKGMDMPKEGGVIVIYKEGNSFYTTKAGEGRKYPLIEVPTPHGRLIDADAAIDDIRREILEWKMNGINGTPPYTSDLRTTWERLEDEDIIPTIIEAEEGADHE